MTPRVSVIVPTRNRLGRLQRAIASVDRQSYRDFEVLVIDDGSTDGTRAWLETEAGALRAFETGSERGASAARNIGIERARGDLVAFLDDDDVWRPSYLAAQVERLDGKAAAALSHADHVEVRDGDGGVARPDLRPIRDYPNALVRMLAEPFIHTMSAVVCRRSMFDRHGLFDERLAIVHDWEWYARLLAADEWFEHVERALVERAVPGGLVTRHRAWFAEERDLLTAAFAAGFGDDPAAARHARLVRVSRSLFFARLALFRGDVGFALLRLADAFSASPFAAVDIAARRVLRQILRRAHSAPELEPRDATAPALP